MLLTKFGFEVATPEKGIKFDFFFKNVKPKTKFFIFSIFYEPKDTSTCSKVSKVKGCLPRS